MHLKHFVVFVRSRAPGEDDWRLGMAVTKKVGSAVVRNRIKRVLREFFRLHQALLPSALDLVVVPKKTLRPETVCLATVERELVPMLRDLGKRFAMLTPAVEETPVRGGLASTPSDLSIAVAGAGMVGP